MKIKVVRYTCDRCGKEFTEDQKMYKEINLPVWEIGQDLMEESLASQSVDLCPACAKRVIKVKFNKEEKKIVF